MDAADDTASESSAPSRSELGEPVPLVWLKSLIGFDGGHMSQVTVDLEHMESGAALQSASMAEIAHHAVEKLSDPSAEVRQACLELVARDQAALRPAAKAIMALLEDPIWHVRRAAVVAVGRLACDEGTSEGGSDAERACLLLVERLMDPDEHVRVSVAKALQWANAMAEPAKALEALARAATADESLHVRVASVSALGGALGQLLRPAGGAEEPASSATGGGITAAQAAIATCCADSVPAVRLAAIDAAVGLAGTAAGRALRPQVAALAVTDHTPDVRLAAERALPRLPE
jgi:HEAT repeat protein